MSTPVTPSDYYNCICYYINQNNAIIDPIHIADNQALFVLNLDVDGNYSINPWNIIAATGGSTGQAVAVPTIEQLNSYTKEMIQAYLVANLSSHFASTVSSLRADYPRFALVQTVFYALCTTNPCPLPMTPTQYQGFIYNCWLAWSQGGTSD